MVLLVALGTGGYMAGASSTFTLKHVQIEGNKHLSDADLLALMRIPDDENLLMLSSERMYERLHSSPWIKSVSIRKILPDTLVVRVDESQPQALISKPNGYVVVDSQGIELERIHGRSERFLPVIRASDLEQTEEFGAALRLASVINDAGISKSASSVEIVGLDGDVKDLSVKIDGLEVKVGEGSYDKKLTRLYELMEEIRKRPFDVEYIDLRFANRVIVKPVAEVVQ